MININHYKKIPTDTDIQFWQLCTEKCARIGDNFHSTSEKEKKT